MEFFNDTPQGEYFAQFDHDLVENELTIGACSDELIENEIFSLFEIPYSVETKFPWIFVLVLFINISWEIKALILAFLYFNTPMDLSLIFQNYHQTALELENLFKKIDIFMCEIEMVSRGYYLSNKKLAVTSNSLVHLNQQLIDTFDTLLEKKIESNLLIKDCLADWREMRRQQLNNLKKSSHQEIARTLDKAITVHVKLHNRLKKTFQTVQNYKKPTAKQEQSTLFDQLESRVYTLKVKKQAYNFNDQSSLEYVQELKIDLENLLEHVNFILKSPSFEEDKDTGKEQDSQFKPLAEEFPIDAFKEFKLEKAAEILLEADVKCEKSVHYSRMNVGYEQTMAPFEMMTELRSVLEKKKM